MIEDRDPIAIIGVGCRFPGGADSPDEFWRLLLDGFDAVGEVPKSRFDLDRFFDPRPAVPGKTSTRSGGFLRDIDRFDADFFGIAPREAERLDPQQRLLLEVAWEALEDAGQVADRLSGTSTGVFVGMWLNDYESRLFADPGGVDFYMTTGSGRYSASGRLSYVFGLQGPSLTVDTACSSSLAAVHLACQSLWSGESALALAGAANTILQPHISVAYSQSQMLSSVGRCKFGDAGADGYVRSEGAAALLLKPLSSALRDGDPVRALIVGSALNNDGSTSGFMTSPGEGGQEDLLRKAYRNAGVRPGQVRYVEAHGTGTRAGDPVELAALGAVLREGRPDERPCAVGSVKTNIGHTEGAAGLAGLIKVALSLQHRQIPASLHFEQPHPGIPWADLPLFIPTETIPWPEVEGPALAGVNAFGIAGTNAHVVLQEAPRAEAREEGPVPARLVLPLSAAGPEALGDVAALHRDFLSAHDRTVSLPDISFTAAVRRGHHDHRLVVAGRSAKEMAERLDAFLAGEARPGLVAGRRDSALSGKTAFVFPGQGGQWLGMGRDLLASEKAFRESVEGCDAAIRAEAGWSLVEELQADEAGSRLAEIDVVQPTLFAVEVGFAAQWRAWGIEPATVVGHSMGEVAAACVAGILTLEDAVRVICRRSRLLRRTRGKGAMAVVELSREEAERALEGHEAHLSVAVCNSPRSTVVSGDPAVLDELIASLEGREVFCRRVKVDVASHSPQMDPLRDALLGELSEIEPRPGDVPLLSTVTGGLVRGEEMNAEYWARNLRQPVLFSDAVRSLTGAGHDVFIEMSPHPILLPALQHREPEPESTLLALPSGRRDEGEQEVMLESLGALHCAGGAVDWSRLFPRGGQVVSLPRYPWQRERFWHEGAVPFAGTRSKSPEPEDRTEAKADETGSTLYEITWRPAPPVGRNPAAADREWLVLADQGGVARTLARHLEECGVEAVLVTPGDAWERRGPRDFVADLRGESPWPRVASQAWSGDWSRCAGVVHLLSLDAEPFVAGPAGLSTRSLEDGCLAVVDLVRHLAAQDGAAPPRLWLITAGTQAVEGLQEVTSPGQAMLWGLGRVAGAEYPRLECSNVDLDGLPEASSVRSLADEVLSGGRESQIAIRAGRRFVPRLIGASGGVAQHDHTPPRPGVPAGAQPFRATVRRPGSTAGVVLEPLRRGRPGPGQVEVEVAAAGLNFMNVLSVLGSCPGYPGGVGPLGGDCAGRVSAVGDGVTSCRPGDEVMGVALTGLATHVLTDASLLVPRPDGLDPAEAATIPIAFLTAFHALESVARIREGERVLVHAATGGVGLAALQLARRRGAVVLGSAGSPAKRELLQSMGIETVVSSRSPEFADAIREATGGRGVDVVLNSLAGGFVEEGLAALAPGGRFVELGKRDLRPGRSLDLGLLGRGRAFLTVDLDRLVRDHPGEIGRELTEIRELLEKGEVEPLPRVEFPASRLAEALETLAEARHTGKVVVRVDDPAATLVPAGFDRDALSEGTTLVTGGLGALGRRTAQWLVENGSRSLVLTGRRPPGPAALAEVEAWEGDGATVRVIQADVSDREEVKRLLGAIDRDLPPLRAVVHAAGVLDDATLAAVSPSQFRSVMAGKVDGAIHLHELTADRQLALFVLYSSVAPLIGSEGQSNYAAANAVLDALARFRRGRDLAATSINWGPWAGSGLAAVSEQRGARLTERGVPSLDPVEGLGLLGRVLAEGSVQAVAARFDWERFREAASDVSGWPFFAEVSRPGQDGEARVSVRETVLGCRPGRERVEALEDHVRGSLARVLRKAAAKLDSDTPFRSQGLDSLMALELRNLLERSFEMPIPATLVWNHPTISALSRELARRATIPLDADSAPVRASTPESSSPRGLESILSELEGLSDEDARQLLADDLPAGGANE